MSTSVGRVLTTRYRPLTSYGAIGDGRSVALVSDDGDIDWWCPARFDGASVFAAILDHEKGGRWSLRPDADARSHMTYVTDTNVLRTEHVTPTGRVSVTDFMPTPAESGVDESIIIRRVQGLDGHVAMDVHFSPRFDYARTAPRFARSPGGITATSDEDALLYDGPALRPAARHTLAGRFDVRAGEAVDLVLRHASLDRAVPFAKPLSAPPEALQRHVITRWSRWAADTAFDGPDAPAVRRAALALKLLQHEETGAIVAAPTTSLPESIGGVRNWDYRYAWIRDGALAARALYDLGHVDDADRFTDWLHATLSDNVDAHRIMYTVAGSSYLPERSLDHLEGYHASQPVRLGNEAVHQRQLDVFGELVLYLHACRSSAAERRSWPVVQRVAEWVVDHWREPDSGIWEVRSAPRHFVLSKAMAWVALMRAARFAHDLDEASEAAHWEREATLIQEQVHREGYDARRGTFVQAYGGEALDAANLLLPLIGFIHPRDERMLSTVDRTLESLVSDGLVYRYLGADDGLPGSEGTFVYCTFWLVEVLAMQGRVREARALFDRVLDRASPLGLFAEEIDAATGAHLGNYPQGFPHVGLIQAARALHDAEHGRGGGTPAF